MCVIQEKRVCNLPISYTYSTPCCLTTWRSYRYRRLCDVTTLYVGLYEMEMRSLPLSADTGVVAVVSRVAIQSIERKRVLVQTCRQSHLSVCLSGKCTVAN